MDEGVQLFLHEDMFKDTIAWLWAAHRFLCACVNSELKVKYRELSTVSIETVPVFLDNVLELLACGWVD